MSTVRERSGGIWCYYYLYSKLKPNSSVSVNRYIDEVFVRSEYTVNPLPPLHFSGGKLHNRGRTYECSNECLWVIKVACHVPVIWLSLFTIINVMLYEIILDYLLFIYALIEMGIYERAQERFSWGTAHERSEAAPRVGETRGN